FDNPAHARALERDGGNRLLWHARRARLEGEAMRDAMLMVSGRLNARIGGPSARPELPAGIETKTSWKPDGQASMRDRRSIYVLAKRNFRYPLLDVFDLPDMHNSCPQRSATVTAPQALALLNGDFTLEQARAWSGRLLKQTAGNVAETLREAFSEAFGQPPSD